MSKPRKIIFGAPPVKWLGLNEIKKRSYSCGHSDCGKNVASERGWLCQSQNIEVAWIYICPICNSPTFFDFKGSQTPGERIGNDIAHLPQDIAQLYEEIRKATTQGAFTAAVLACRKLLMHIAVEKGAQPGEKFVNYVDYLVNNHYAPPNSRQWVDKIRRKGNEANHEIRIMSKDNAKDIITFIEMLLKFNYELPGMVSP